ncbi:MAG: metal-dependent hydrolase [Leifsonia flava]
MTLPATDTVVLYPAGSTRNGAVVLHLEPVPDGRMAVLLDETACHPVDAGWPDQGTDRAVFLTSTGDEVAVTEAVVAATDGEALFIGADVPVRKGEEGWAFVVAHLVAPDAAVSEGDEVTVVVDEEYRNALSIGHTACHLASLALNRALADRWTKEVRVDGLGEPDFDGAAIASSLIRENGSTDVFRLNKSLRRKGFAADGLAEQLAAIEAATGATLAAWISEDAPVHIDVAGPGLTDRRSWVADLAEASVSIPCGGTHVSALSELGSLTVALELADVDGTPTLTMLTDATG